MTPNDLDIAAVRLLESGSRAAFLATFGFNLTLGARGSYPVDSEDGEIGVMCGLNEAAQLVFRELLHDSEHSESRPTSPEWLKAARIKAEHYNAVGPFQEALRRSVQSLT